MKTWAEIDINNIVINTIKATDSFISLTPGTFVECTEETRLGSIGMTYNKEKNKFVYAQPYPSWSLNEESLEWESPIGAKPNDDKSYVWNEENKNWVILTPLDINL
jgi:hypothetical protein